MIIDELKVENERWKIHRMNEEEAAKLELRKYKERVERLEQ